MAPCGLVSGRASLTQAGRLAGSAGQLVYWFGVKAVASLLALCAVLLTTAAGCCTPLRGCKALLFSP